MNSIRLYRGHASHMLLDRANTRFSTLNFLGVLTSEELSLLRLSSPVAGGHNYQLNSLIKLLKIFFKIKRIKIIS